MHDLCVSLCHSSHEKDRPHYYSRKEHCLLHPGPKLKIESQSQRKIHARRFKNTAELREYSERLKFNKRASDELLTAACETLYEAKKVHDRIESYYVSAMDFEKCKKYQKDIFSGILKRL